MQGNNAGVPVPIVTVIRPKRAEIKADRGLLLIGTTCRAEGKQIYILWAATLIRAVRGLPDPTPCVVLTSFNQRGTQGVSLSRYNTRTNDQQSTVVLPWNTLPGYHWERIKVTSVSQDNISMTTVGWFKDNIVGQAKHNGRTVAQ